MTIAVDSLSKDMDSAYNPFFQFFGVLQTEILLALEGLNVPTIFSLDVLPVLIDTMEIGSIYSRLHEPSKRSTIGLLIQKPAHVLESFVGLPARVQEILEILHHRGVKIFKSVLLVVHCGDRCLKADI